MDNTYVVKIDVYKKSVDIVDIKENFLRGRHIDEIIGCEQGFECVCDEYLMADMHCDGNAYQTAVPSFTFPWANQYYYNNAVLCAEVDENGDNPCLTIKQANSIKILIDENIKWKDAN